MKHLLSQSLPSLTRAAEDGALYGVALGLYVILGILAIVVLLSFIFSLVSVLGSARYTGGGKTLWVVIIFVFPIVGPLAWWLGGKDARIRTDGP